MLRVGHLYGPGTIYASDGSFTRQVRAGKAPLVGGGTSVFSFSHVHDVATAFVAAVDRRPVGPINVVDDDPAPMSTWLPYFADVIGAKPPKNVPAFAGPARGRQLRRRLHDPAARRRQRPRPAQPRLAAPLHHLARRIQGAGRHGQ